LTIKPASTYDCARDNERLRLTRDPLHSDEDIEALVTASASVEPAEAAPRSVTSSTGTKSRLP